MDKYQFTELNMDMSGKQFEEEPSSNEEAGDHIRNMHILSERYAVENEIIQAISKGELHTTQMLVSKFGKVHPIHIDRLSSSIAYK